mmetsp:Transcript_21622/g.50516  ORF Transcript_21622/g.50516 Transcript_21622/m.50516 type:complete len:1018 (-) Transcript_21622:141-3194(-)
MSVRSISLAPSCSARSARTPARSPTASTSGYHAHAPQTQRIHLPSSGSGSVAVERGAPGSAQHIQGAQCTAHTACVVSSRPSGGSHEQGAAIPKGAPAFANYMLKSPVSVQERTKQTSWRPHSPTHAGVQVRTSTLQQCRPMVTTQYGRSRFTGQDRLRERPRTVVCATPPAPMQPPAVTVAAQPVPPKEKADSSTQTTDVVDAAVQCNARGSLEGALDTKRSRSTSRHAPDESVHEGEGTASVSTVASESIMTEALSWRGREPPEVVSASPPARPVRGRQSQSPSRSSRSPLRNSRSPLRSPNASKLELSDLSLRPSLHKQNPQSPSSLSSTAGESDDLVSTGDAGSLSMQPAAIKDFHQFSLWPTCGSICSTSSRMSGLSVASSSTYSKPMSSAHSMTASDPLSDAWCPTRVNSLAARASSDLPKCAFGRKDSAASSETSSPLPWPMPHSCPDGKGGPLHQAKALIKEELVKEEMLDEDDEPALQAPSKPGTKQAGNQKVVRIQSPSTNRRLSGRSSLASECPSFAPGRCSFAPGDTSLTESELASSEWPSMSEDSTHLTHGEVGRRTRLTTSFNGEIGRVSGQGQMLLQRSLSAPSIHSVPGCDNRGQDTPAIIASKAETDSNQAPEKRNSTPEPQIPAVSTRGPPSSKLTPDDASPAASTPVFQSRSGTWSVAVPASTRVLTTHRSPSVTRWSRPETGTSQPQLPVPRQFWRSFPMVAFDFDLTLTTIMLGFVSEDCFKKDITEVSADEFGGKERLALLKQMFSVLQSCGVHFFIVSYGWLHRVRTALERVGLLEFFSDADLVCRESQELRDHLGSKVSVVKARMQKLNLRPEDAVLIDDSWSNLQGASGICTAFLSNSEPPGLSMENIQNLINGYASTRVALASRSASSTAPAQYLPVSSLKKYASVIAPATEKRPSTVSSKEQGSMTPSTSMCQSFCSDVGVPTPPPASFVVPRFRPSGVSEPMPYASATAPSMRLSVPVRQTSQKQVRVALPPGAQVRSRTPLTALRQSI